MHVLRVPSKLETVKGTPLQLPQGERFEILASPDAARVMTVPPGEVLCLRIHDYMAGACPKSAAIRVPVSLLDVDANNDLGQVTAPQAIDHEMDNGADDDDDDDLDTCPTCNGEGTSWDGLFECLDCGGFGH